MSASSAGVRSGLAADAWRARLGSSLREQLFPDPSRTAQTVLGLIWLLDAGLQFQSFMYSKGFTAMLTAMAAGQPHWLASSIDWGAHTAAGDLGVYNTLFASIQVAIGLALLYRPTVKLGLLGTFAWSLVVWWFGEAFGMLFMNMAQPLTGAPGAIVYALVGLAIWPNGRPGGLLGVRGARIAWGALWLVCAYLWLLQTSASASAIHEMIDAAPSGMSWLSSLQDGFASITSGNSLIVAVVLSALSAAIGVGVGLNRWARPLLLLAAGLQLLYWLVGQGFGGIFEGGATDPNTAPLFLVLTYMLARWVPYRVQTETTLPGSSR